MPQAKQLVTSLFAAAPAPVALRAAAMLRQQYSIVKMPTPALGGGLGADQLAAYAGDWDAYRLLALLSRLVPAALRPAMPPTFTVAGPRLLRAVEHWAMAGARLAGAAAAGEAEGGGDGGGEGEGEGKAEAEAEAEGEGEGGADDGANAWALHAGWSTCGAQAEGRLMEHQKAAVARMHQRDETADVGHFLILDTGMGKTVTALVYAWRWLRQHGGAVRRILWVTPAGTIDNLLAQLRRTWGAPVHLVPRVSAAKIPKQGEGASLQLRDFAVNVIHADHLRTAIDKGLAEQATSSFVIFDEVDEMYAPTLHTRRPYSPHNTRTMAPGCCGRYAPTLRTSAARALCALCPKFVAQTATPMRRNEAQLLAWLADTCAFPVTATNMLVAASAMVPTQLEP